MNFRIDEARVILDLPRTDLLLGQGIGGRFLGKDVNGLAIVTPWTHAFPLWVLLKGGLARPSRGRPPPRPAPKERLDADPPPPRA